LLPILSDLTHRARNVPESGIVELVNHARMREGLIPLWVGEGDLPTPDFITHAATQALENGETFYTWQRGIPELRQALANYHTKHFGQIFSAEEFFVTGSGMQSIQLALQAIAGAGDETLYCSPAWPNFAAAAEIAGAFPVPVALDFGSNGWALDVEKLRAAATARTKAIFVNTPSNPTGWTADSETLRAILDFARQRGLWIIADEIYSRFYFSGPRAPSFLDVMNADDRIVFVNSFSKNWAMTGWRVGWIKAHPSLGQVLENLVQYSTSGVAQFMQRGAVAALEQGDGFVDMQVNRAQQARDLVSSTLLKTGRVRCAPPEGAFYLYFQVDGISDTRTAAKEIVDKTGIGLAPGIAFGSGASGGFRLCFNRKLSDIEDASARLSNWLTV
jgi:aspartate/methionine/tyrosine aminotransferase